MESDSWNCTQYNVFVLVKQYYIWYITAAISLLVEGLEMPRAESSPLSETTMCALHWPARIKCKHWTIMVPRAKQIPADTTTQEETPAMFIFVATFLLLTQRAEKIRRVHKINHFFRGLFPQYHWILMEMWRTVGNISQRLFHGILIIRLLYRN